jgi:hypothetical protein
MRPSDHNDRRAVDVTPSASRLTGSLRDIGYDFQSALADVVDNSVAAGATQVDVELVFDGPRSYVLIADNGSGMSESTLNEALRFGSRRQYALGELGRYGLGLKTASISQCRSVTVVTRRALQRRRIAAKTLDLAHIESTDRWEIVDPPITSQAFRSLEWLNDSPGTVVLWEDLDRMFATGRSEGGWARRRLEHLAVRSRGYLGMVFHRFLEGSAQFGNNLVITVNGEKAEPWNPFAPLEEARAELQPLTFEVEFDGQFGKLHLHRYVLPSKNRFSTASEFERLSGPLKWNRQQGLYIYRADRLIQHGGWSGIRALDEHTKLGRAALDFQTDLDALFQINVAKMRVTLPPEVKTVLEKPVHELCHRADAAYRGDADRTAVQGKRSSPQGANDTTGREIGAALMTAALNCEEHEAFLKVMANLRKADPRLAKALGW